MREILRIDSPLIKCSIPTMFVASAEIQKKMYWIASGIKKKRKVWGNLHAIELLEIAAFSQMAIEGRNAKEEMKKK